MIQIRPLATVDPVAFERIMSGYVSNEKYVVTKQEAPERTTITLELVRLDTPYVKRWPLTGEDWERYAAIMPLGYSLGAFDDALLVGIALCSPHEWNKTLWVDEFHIAESHQRRGVGRQLMAQVAERGCAGGYRILGLEAQNTNVPAIRFYRAVGFTLDGVDVSLYTNNDLLPGREVAVFMKRPLEATHDK
ncbi:MAG: GNAT family N-acetyltransferase [Anaerolineae bacterium]